MTADSRKESRELRNLQSLAGHSQGKYIVQLLDEFLHHGPNGSHQCLVFELLGPSLGAVITVYHDGGDNLEPEIVLKMSQQLLQAIAFIHDLGYAHGGMMPKWDRMRLNSKRALNLPTGELIFIALPFFPKPRPITRLGMKDSIFLKLCSRESLTELNSLGNGQLLRSRVEQQFDERVHDQALKPLLPVIQGLMRFMPEDRISASQALDLITSETAKMNRVEKA